MENVKRAASESYDATCNGEEKEAMEKEFIASRTSIAIPRQERSAGDADPEYDDRVARA
jgi:hypothetical protein